MRIAIDFREGAKPQRAGKGEYVRELTLQLAKTMPASAQLILLVETGQQIEADLQGCTIKTFPKGLGMWHLLVSLWLTCTRPVDLYWAATSVIVPAITIGTPMITTVFDFSAWHFPLSHHRLATVIERILARRAYRKSRHLLAISEFTKTETIHLLGVDPARITVTPLGIDHKTFYPRTLQPQRLEELRAKYGLPQKFILYLGTLEPRKNLLTLIDAFSRIEARVAPTQLVLAGAAGWSSTDILAAANSTSGVVVTGYIAASDRPLLYAAASLFVFPSRYEGFGIPPLEAMASGVPVVVSSAASLPEVVGDAGVIVDPNDAGALATALEQVLGSASKRAKLREQGLLQAKDATWQRAAIITKEVIMRYAATR